VAQRVSVEFVGPFTFNGIRFAIGALSLLPLTFLLKSSSGWRPTLLPGLAAGCVLFIAASLQQLGLIWTTAGKAAFLTGFYILLVPVIGLFLKKRPGPGVWWGALFGLSGLYLLSVTAAFTVELGDGLEMIGAVFWSVHILLIDHWGPRVDPLKLSMVQFSVCAVLSLAVGLPVEPFSFDGLMQCLPALLYASVGAVGIAYTLQVVGQRGVAPGPAALILSLETVFAALSGWLVLGELLGARELIGCGLMLTGMLLAQLWPRREKGVSLGPRSEG
jgi:drug/metabolite transporter (DMT)-like permease